MYESGQPLIYDATFLTLWGKHAPRTSGPPGTSRLAQRRGLRAEGPGLVP